MSHLGPNMGEMEDKVKKFDLYTIIFLRAVRFRTIDDKYGTGIFLRTTIGQGKFFNAL